MMQEEIEAIVAQYPLRDVREIVLALVIRVHDAALEEAANKSVDAILDDLTDRRGLRQEWEEMDADVQMEIIEEWRRIIRDLKIGEKS